MKDEKFKEKMKSYILYKNLEDKYLTLEDYLEAAKEKHENQVFYVTDEVQQAQYINMFKEQGMDAVILKHPIDQPFISVLEGDDENLKFHRIDTDLSDVFKEEVSEEDSKVLEENTKTLTEIFKKALGRENLEVKVEKLKNAETSSMITLKEESRRMQDMMKMYGMTDMSMFGNEGETLILNANHTLVKYILEHGEGEHTDIICQQLYDLALLSHKPLEAAALTAFIQRSNKIMEILAK